MCSLSGCWEQNGGRDTDEESEWSPAAASIQPCWAGGDRDGDDGDHDDGDGDILMMKEVATVRPTTPITISLEASIKQWKECNIIHISVDIVATETRIVATGTKTYDKLSDQ